MKSLLLVTLLLIGCAQRSLREQVTFNEARRMQLECVSYYVHREPQLLYPDPTTICQTVFQAALRGQLVRWRL